MLRISNSVSAETVIKKSRFVCQLARVAGEEAAQDFIAAVRKEHPKANHHCVAYILGENAEVQRMSDDGEPSGTAGVPMLEVLKKRKLTDICAVVTRYFGGVKLGTGGLIRAYSHSVSQALDAATFLRTENQEKLQLRLDYSLYDSLQHFVSEQELQLTEPIFTENVTVSVFVNSDGLTHFCQR